MISIEKELKEKSKELKQLICFMEKKKRKEPKGSLRVSKTQKQYSYYHYLSDKKQEYPVGKYISKANTELIQALAQKDYDSKILEWAKACNAALNKFICIYQDNKCEEIYEKLKDAKKQFVKPYELFGEEYANKWLSNFYEGKKFNPEDNYFITEKGERVRSKSEKILADKFFKMNIPYKYECPLNLKGFGIVYPDFTLLNKRTKKEYYWEHFGMMDNPEYIQKTIMKIHTYEMNHVFPGKDLLFSFELKNNLSQEVIDTLIREYLL